MFGWLSRGRQPEARSCRFFVLAVKAGDWPSAETLSAVWDRLTTLDPDWCALAQPSLVYGCFVAERDGARCSREARDALTPLLGPGGAIGEAEGELVARFDGAGRLASAPVGDAVNAAVRRAQ